MASVLPAMRGQFGDTAYYLLTMHAKELTERLVIPQELDGWEDLTLEERYQREINYGRVKRQIAPYLLTDPDRFFGAFIVSMLNAGQIEFEPIERIYKGTVPMLYRTAAEALGFLTLSGDELMVPLDGQHRLAAIRFAITGKDEKQQPLANYSANAEIAGDVCTVMVIEHDEHKSRKIFNKVNRYAKPTSKSENLITADDDIFAVILREYIIGTHNVIPDRLVNAKSNTLTTKAPEFTTLAALYECTKDVLENTHGKIRTDQLPPTKAEQNILIDEARVFWETVCSEITLFAEALGDASEAGDLKRREMRTDFLLGRPVAQWAAVRSIIRLREPIEGVRISLEEACNRINQLSWSSQDPRWQNVLMSGDRVVAGKTAVNNASRIIAFWLGEKLTEHEAEHLRVIHVANGGSGELGEPIILSGAE